MDSFMQNHQSALDNQREDDASQYHRIVGFTPILMMNIIHPKQMMITNQQMTKLCRASVQNGTIIYEKFI